MPIYIPGSNVVVLQWFFDVIFLMPPKQRTFLLGIKLLTEKKNVTHLEIDGILTSTKFVLEKDRFYLINVKLF